MSATQSSTGILAEDARDDEGPRRQSEGFLREYREQS